MIQSHAMTIVLRLVWHIFIVTDQQKYYQNGGAERCLRITIFLYAKSCLFRCENSGLNRHKQLVCSIPRLSAPYCNTSGQNQLYGNILLYETSVFIVKMADHDGNHKCLVEKNVPIVLILPSRWQDGAESLGTETTSCL